MQPEDVLCFAGAEEAIYLAMHVLLDPGDHAVVLTPNYQAAETIPLSICEVTGVPLRPEDGLGPRRRCDRGRAPADHPPRLRELPQQPHRRRGRTPAEWQRLVDLCTERGITLFSDEVYRGLELDRTPLPQAADLSPTAISLNVMSKAYGLPGLRIGWVACRDQKLLHRLGRAKDYTTICNSAPSEVLALIGLRAREVLLDRNRRIVADNLPRFAEFFGRFPELFAWEAPQGGCVCFPQYLGPDGVEAMCADLVEQAGVLLLPARMYRSELTPVPTDRFRVGVGRLGADEALAQWSDWLKVR